MNSRLDRSHHVSGARVFQMLVEEASTRLPGERREAENTRPLRLPSSTPSRNFRALSNAGALGTACDEKPGMRRANAILRGLMRLTPDEIQYISRKIVKTLVGEGKLEVDSETRVVDAIGKVITEELQIEDRLNDEVREVLLEHSSQMERSDITYTDMFKKVKRELAKKKGIVL
jgi:polyhydroxyalkanoate synthesis regulator phasin